MIINLQDELDAMNNYPKDYLLKEKFRLQKEETLRDSLKHSFNYIDEYSFTFEFKKKHVKATGLTKFGQSISFKLKDGTWK